MDLYCCPMRANKHMCLRVDGSFTSPSQYLQLVADFQPADQTLLFMVFGIAALVVQALVLPWLLCITTERNVLAIGTSHIYTHAI